MKCIAFFLVIGYAMAAPQIISVSDTTPSDGQTITISGSGFGIKSPVEPLKWDRFESGSPGDVVSGWSHTSSRGRDPAYSDEYSYQGSQSLFIDFTGGQGMSGAYLRSSEGWNTLYMTFQMYYYHNGDPSGNFKIGRFTADEPDEYHGNPKIGLTYDCNGWPWHYNAGDDLLEPYWCYKSIGSDEWHRWEQGSVLSDVDLANGMAFASVDGDFCSFDRDIVTLHNSYDYPAYRTAVLPHYCSHEARCSDDRAGGDYWVYVDDAYIDDTIMRVEIGNAPVFEDCTIREIQIPKNTWNNNNIEIEVNTGRLSGAAYLFVIDKEGYASQGYPIQLGSGCVSNCAGKECGSDGCGGSCGTCLAGETCNNFQCAPICIADCSGKECGEDGCGGSCGTCASGEACTDFQCEAPQMNGNIIDNTDGTKQGGWSASTHFSGYYGSDYEYTYDIGDTFDYPIDAKGTYELYVWWVEHADRPSSVDYVVSHSGGETIIQKDQRTGGSQWNSLGNFTDPEKLMIVSTTVSGQGTCADAIKLRYIGDTDDNGLLTLSELITHIDNWKSGFIELTEIMNAIKIWKN